MHIQGIDAGDLEAFLEPASTHASMWVGDGCRIWAARSEREFELVAADHRDGAIGDVARAGVGSTLSRPDGAWLTQALRSGATLNPPLLEDRTWSDLGLDRSEPVDDVLVVPLPAVGCVMVATRDRVNGRYLECDRIRLERIAAEAAANGAGGSAAGNGSSYQPSQAPGRVVNGEMLELAAVAVWGVDGNGITTYVNRAAAELVGLPAGRIEGVPMAEFVAPGSPLTGAEAGSTVEVPLLRADGSARWARVRSRVLDEDGTTVHTLHDVTDQHRRSVDLRVRLDIERSLARLAMFLLWEPSPEAIACRVVATLSEQFGPEVVPIGAVCGDDDEDPVLLTGDDDELPDELRGREEPVRELMREALESNEIVTVGQRAGRPSLDTAEIVPGTGLRSAVIVPIASGRACIAILSRREDGITAFERDMVERVADLLTAGWDRILPSA